MTPRYVAAATLALVLGKATAFLLASGRQRLLGSEQSVISAARLSACDNLTFASKSLKRGRHGGGQAHREHYSYHYGRDRRRLHLRAHKALNEDPSTVGKVSSDEPADGTSFLDELLERCTEATRSDGAIESSHTGSSEWAGFKTTPELLEGVRLAMGRARQRSRHSDGSAMAWSWLTLSPRPVRVTVSAANPRFAVYLTVLPAGNGNPPSHRPMYGCHMLSRVLAGEVQQVKSNSQRVIGRSAHSLETPVWSSFGGGARRLVNENFQPAVILEVVLYDWSRGSGYSGSYAAPGTSSSGSAERRAEAEEGGALGGASADADAKAGAGPKEGGVGGVFPIVVMDECPCPPDLLFRDGDVYEEEEEEDKDGGAAGGLTLVRRDGKMAESRHGGGGEGEGKGGNNAFKELFTADELACDVGGLDGQLEDIVRRVLSTRSIPSELRQALGVGHVRGLLLHGPPGCGKTLLARELSRRLGARPPKLVSGPEILDKWVGEAERKVRLLFLDAELEHERCIQMGEDPAELPLNLVCFDEIDALCRRRGSLSGDTSGVRDSVVNQILSKMDGLVNLQNVLVVGMTNRKELLDEALLRPGRMEVCMPIPLPDAGGRQQILAIHLRKARDAGLVSPEVDDACLAKKTRGFSGADLAGLVRSATSFAIADWRQRDPSQASATATVADDDNSLNGAKGGGGRGDGNHVSPPPPLPVAANAVQAGEREAATTTQSGMPTLKPGSSGVNGAGARVAPAGEGGDIRLVVTVGNFEQALLEVGVSGGGGPAGAGGRLGALRGAVRGGLARVMPQRG